MDNFLGTAITFQSKRFTSGTAVSKEAVSRTSLLLAAHRSDGLLAAIMQSAGVDRDRLYRVSGVPAGPFEHSTATDTALSEAALAALQDFHRQFPAIKQVGAKAIAYACLVSPESRAAERVREAGGDIDKILQLLRPALEEEFLRGEPSTRLPPSTGSDKQPTPAAKPSVPIENKGAPLSVGPQPGFDAFYHVVPQRKHIGLLPGAFSDRIGDIDFLGFAPYIEALADLIESPHTQLPLTIGVYGDWGTGKSFLLDHLKRKLEERRRSRPSEPTTTRVFPVAFNAWEYGAAQVVWPRLARCILDGLEKHLFDNWFERLFKRILRNFRHHWRADWLQTVFRALVALTVPVSVAVLMPTTGTVSVIGLKVALPFALLTAAWQWAFRHPLTQSVSSLFSPRAYGKLLEHFDEIRFDLRDLAKALTKQRARALVLIDDLDRCVPERAVEVLQSVHFMLDLDSIVVCLAVDADALSAAIRSIYGQALPHSEGSGYSYLDKIVQIPFSIPTPSTEEISLFLSGHTSPPSMEKEHETDNRQEPTTEGVRLGRAATVARKPPLSPMPEPELLIENAAFSQEESEAFLRLASFVHRNPRHMKRLANVYRLVRALAQRREEGFVLRDPAKTLWWLLLCAQWPAAAKTFLEKLYSIPLGTGDIRDVFESPFDFLTKAIEEHGISGLGDSYSLRRLLMQEDLEPSWDQLAVLARFTINFIPPIAPAAHPE
jgi:Cdc6-like AAA superfamily ATPase